MSSRFPKSQAVCPHGQLLRQETQRKLGVPGEETFAGAGVSYCATCDGAFFKDKTVAVVGGGDVALEDALYLANICKQVYLIHRRNELRGTVYFGFSSVRR